jgi:hypothetical protein
VDFIDSKTKAKHGVLQEFIDPPGDQNRMFLNIWIAIFTLECLIRKAKTRVEMLQMLWTPKLSVFSRKFNKKKIDDPSFSIYERMLTFDGPEMYSDSGKH